MQDYALGIRIARIAGRATLDGTTVRIDRLHGRAGSGSIEWAGTIGVFAPEMPVDMTVTARNARILNSDRLTATLDAALNLHGEGTGVLTAEDQVDVREASIRIPERFPRTIATPNVRRSGVQPLAKFDRGQPVHHGLELPP